MALGVCRECGKEVSSEAKTCPHCGIKQPIRKSNIGCFVVGGLVLVVLVLASIGSHTSAPTSSTASDPSKASTSGAPAEEAATTAPAPPPSPWDYNDSTDEMRDAPIHVACTISTDEVNLNFPYGTQRVRLCVRQHPRFGEDVYIRLENEGQFLCSSYDGCNVRVRFDNNAVSTFSATEASDNSTNVIFVSNHSRFIQGLKHASQVRIEAEFFQAGVQQMTFDTSGLVWPRPTRP